MCVHRIAVCQLLAQTPHLHGRLACGALTMKLVSTSCVSMAYSVHLWLSHHVVKVEINDNHLPRLIGLLQATLLVRSITLPVLQCAEDTGA